jgi:hypothetical protein
MDAKQVDAKHQETLIKRLAFMHELANRDAKMENFDAMTVSAESLTDPKDEETIRSYAATQGGLLSSYTFETSEKNKGHWCFTFENPVRFFTRAIVKKRYAEWLARESIDKKECRCLWGDQESYAKSTNPSRRNKLYVRFLPDVTAKAIQLALYMYDEFPGDITLSFQAARCAPPENDLERYGYVAGGSSKTWIKYAVGKAVDPAANVPITVPTCWSTSAVIVPEGLPKELFD